MPTKRRFRDTVTILIGIALFVGIIGIGWLPRSCPLLRQWLASCPATQVANAPLTPQQVLDAKYPSQVIDKEYADFQVNSQANRATTEVKFEYKADLTKQVAQLGLRVGSTLQYVALVTHPLLVNLNWPRYSITEPNETMYQRTQTYDTSASLKANLPPASQLAVDTEIANSWGLQASQYQPLETLTSLDGINYIVTTYTPQSTDGDWHFYDQTFDATSAFVDQNNQIDWRLYLPNVATDSQPFRMTTVHVDYKKVS